jgi:hypothetical protein
MQLDAIARFGIRRAHDRGKVNVAPAKRNFAPAHTVTGVNAFDDFMAAQSESCNFCRQPVKANR